MNNEQTKPDSGDEDAPTPQLSPDEAKAVIRAISDVEREEADAARDSPAKDDS